MKNIVYILKKLYNGFESCSREQVLRTILYLVNVNSWKISPEEELLNLLIDKLLEIVNKIYDIVDEDYFSRNDDVKDKILLSGLFGMLDREKYFNNVQDLKLLFDVFYFSTF